MVKLTDLESFKINQRELEHLVVMCKGKEKQKLIARLLLTLLIAVYCFGYGAMAEESHAAGNLTIKAGFYGGPYYDIKVYSYGEMTSMAGGVYTYSGVDSGGFMRICYAWGVPMSTLVSNAGIELNSVSYFHMGTADGYGESYTTFSSGFLMSSKNFYPHMIDAFDKDGPDAQCFDFNNVSSEFTADAQSVPTMIAVGSSAFSRENAADAARNGYRSYSPGQLSGDYRLIFGQAGLSDINSANNVRMSDKYVNEINVQLTGTPNIVVEKELISGEEGEIGSKYSVKVNISLPDSYSYLPENVLKQLEKQILSSLRLGNYDKSVIKVTKQSDGEYIVEIVGEGDTDLKFSYSRNEYNGGYIFASGKTHISGTGSGGTGATDPTTPTQPTEPEPDPTEPITPTEPEPTDPTTPTEPIDTPTQPTEAPAAEQETENEYLGIAEESSEPVVSDSSSVSPPADVAAAQSVDPIETGVEWVAADDVSMSANEAMGEEKENIWKVALGAAVLFAFGFAGTLGIFFRRI